MLKSRGIMATKVGMTQLFLADGVLVPVTVLHIKENLVIKKRESEIDGYDALLVGYDDIKDKALNKASRGFFAKNNVAPKRYLKEFRVEKSELAQFEALKPISLDFLKQEGCSVDVFGVSKGKGTAGVMKRHNFAGAPASHGAHETSRGGGSIGQREKPGKVIKGKRMAGRMGNERISVKNVRVIRFIEDEGILCLRGGIPGTKGSLIELRISSRKAKSIRGVAGLIEEKAAKNPMKASKAGAKAAAPKAPAKK